MNEAALRDLLGEYAAGCVDADEVVRRVRSLPFTDLGFATVDHHRELRQGVPEAVYSPGKRPAESAGIVRELLTNGGATPSGGGPVMLTRANAEQVTAAVEACPGGSVTPIADGMSMVVWRPSPPRGESVVVMTAGTSDLPVADECAAVLAAFGFEPVRVTDVGVAGIHRVLARAEQLQEADAVVVVAGMEGALASVVGGLTSAPVVAVPTSVGYGSSLDGVTALLGMLSSSASGVVVVGIDNGFGAAFAVWRTLGPVKSANEKMPVKGRP